jgi:hypothetical protein
MGAVKVVKVVRWWWSWSEAAAEVKGLRSEVTWGVHRTMPHNAAASTHHHPQPPRRPLPPFNLPLLVRVLLTQTM